MRSGFEGTWLGTPRHRAGFTDRCRRDGLRLRPGPMGGFQGAIVHTCFQHFKLPMLKSTGFKIAPDQRQRLLRSDPGGALPALARAFRATA